MVPARCAASASSTSVRIWLLQMTCEVANGTALGTKLVASAQAVDNCSVSLAR